jgi:hypothetical protein
LDIFTQGFNLKLEILDKDLDTDDNIAVIKFPIKTMPDVHGSPVFDVLKDGSAT